MIFPRLADLPSSHAGETGWSWTEKSCRLADSVSDGQMWPRISILTPSANQSEFIEETLRSIVLQGYPDIEYFTLDGGSTGSLEIIKKYSSRISNWISQPHPGRCDAINTDLSE